MTSSSRPRFLPDVALPETVFISGRGLSHPRHDDDDDTPDPADDGEAWRLSDPTSSSLFRRSVDLFNHGAYWEAHEGWETLWHRAGREGVEAELLKGAIKLAAAGVKIRQGQASGVRSHAERALAHFDVAEASGELVDVDWLSLLRRLAREALGDELPPPDESAVPRPVYSTWMTMPSSERVSR